MTLTPERAREILDELEPQMEKLCNLGAISGNALVNAAQDPDPVLLKHALGQTALAMSQQNILIAGLHAVLAEYADYSYAKEEPDGSRE